MAFDIAQIELFPKKPGVYLMKSFDGQILYVGKAKDLRARIKQYFSLSRDGRLMVPYLTSQIDAIDTIITLSEREALLLENTLIKRHQPKYNVLLKDDKTFISLMVNHKHPWPMVRLVRFKGKPKEKALYFGPYTNALAARETMRLISTLFPLRQCSDKELVSRKRPCLLYAIKRCIAPCVGKCTKEEYHGYVDHVTKFLKGQNKEIITTLKQRMETASSEHRYEEAGDLLRKIRHLEDVADQSKAMAVQNIEDCDVLGFYRELDRAVLIQLLFRDGKLIGSESFSFDSVASENEEILEAFILQHYLEKTKPPPLILVPFSLEQAGTLSEILKDEWKQAAHIFPTQKGGKKDLVEMANENAFALFKQEISDLERQEKILLDLQESLHLNRFPLRIECFDTSHISSSDPVASMVAFTEGKYDRQRTRIFHIKSAKKGDDYGALEEVLLRHLKKSKEQEDLPDLVIVDGGKGQLGIAMKVFKTLEIANVDLLAVTKEEGKHIKGMTKEKVYMPYHSEPVLLKPHSPLLFLLQKIRDEAHRVAIGFHRRSRKKRVIASAIDEIPGIGPIKKKRLLSHFGSLKRILEASDEELKKIPGITKKDIENLRKVNP